ncbi:MAG: gamma carbonic anhydrase family protein [Coriobacteriia bacterium]|nr:gamma carbonic anhydrase family protein [Coriobacteriia bacterium]
MTSYFNVSADATCRISPSSSILGTVQLGPESSVFAGACIRGDLAPIRIGARSNIQENACLHVDTESPLTVGEGVTVGHGAILHGCTVGDGCTVGMGAVVMNDARIGAGSMVAAGAVVSQGKDFPERSLIMGVPGRLVRTLSEEESRTLCVQPAEAYVACSAEMAQQGAMLYPGATFCGQP